MLQERLVLSDLERVGGAARMTVFWAGLQMIRMASWALMVIGIALVL